MTRTLEPGVQISRYRIVGPLGAGGMGEVYRAHDNSLERDVALKILPPHLVQSEERVRRFMLEARSASSLNHPNIVTIYEIGAEPISSDGLRDGTTGAVHFISMELVSGETLGQKIHEEAVDLKTLLGWLAQAAEGISKAHAAGIVHRDLKPGNIMISSDGYAKVLDFGLAKLTEKAGAGDALHTSAPTEAHDHTAEGAILGTAGYMSPEQVVGKPVDHRTDIFSFGAILYEAATRRRPFVAESSVETLHRILHDKPAPIEEINPAAPAELRRLIRRCLAKSPDQRFQSMKDVAIELREIVDEFDALSASAGSGSGSGSGSGISHAGGTGAAIAAERRRSPLVPILAAAGVVAAIGIAFGVWGVLRGGTSRDTAPPAVQTNMATSRGDVREPVVSPDGRYLAYLGGPPGQERLRVRQIATGSDIDVLPTQGIPPHSFVFSPDGNYIFYLNPDPDRGGYKALFQVPSLGGTPIKKLYDIDSPVTFAPDGRELAFLRGVPTAKEWHLLVFGLESGQERVLTKLTAPTGFVTSSLAWSPDGRTIATIQTNESIFGNWIVLYNTSDGRPAKTREIRVPLVETIAWTPDARSLVMAGIQQPGNPRSQIMKLDLKTGTIRPITSGFDNYGAVSITTDGTTLAALRNATVSNIWTLDLSGPAASARQITFSSNSENSVGSPRPAVDGTIYYESPSNGRLSIWSMAADGGSPRPLTSGSGFDGLAFPVPGGAVFQRIDEALLPRIFRVDADGGNQKAILTGNGEVLLDVSPDGRFILFQRIDDPDKLLVLPVGGGEPRVVAEDYSDAGFFSPDGELICYRTLRTIGGMDQFTSALIRTGDGQPVPMRPIPPQAGNYEITSDGPSFLYLNRVDPAGNIFRQEVNDNPPTQVTRFTDGRVLGLAPSPDGSRILIARQVGPSQNLWLTGRDGMNPVQLTSFQSGSIFDAEWTPDGGSVVFSQGIQSRDAVLVKGF